MATAVRPRLPILFHYLPTPVPYKPALELQERLHQLQLAIRRQSWQSHGENPSGGVNEGAHKSHPDILLLLQHRPVYTGGRRQQQWTDELELEQKRLQHLGADWVPTARGGETTFHGPGQIVAYPLFDLGRMSRSIRCYIDDLQSLMQQHVSITHRISTTPSSLTGVFVTPTSKIGSIGVQVRHRLTTHGLSLNITPEPLAWFDQVVACGLPGVRQTSIGAELGREVRVENEIVPLVKRFGEVFRREMRPVLEDEEPEVYGMIRELEIIGENAGSCLTGPSLSAQTS